MRTRRFRRPKGTAIRRAVLVVSALFLLAYAAFVHWLGIKPSKAPAKDVVKKQSEIAPHLKMLLVKWFPFSDAAELKEWEEKVFKSKVIYTVEKDKVISYVKAESASSASALYYRLKLDAKKRRPLLSWKWKVGKFPVKKMPESLETQAENDFAARVYLIFPAMFFTNSKVVEYVWTERLPAGTMGTSPYSKNIKIVVVRSGIAPAEDGWAFEERDVVADYQALFGRKPEYDLGAVAFMTNAEHTASTAEGMYDDIKVGYMDKNGGGEREKELSAHKVSDR